MNKNDIDQTLVHVEEHQKELSATLDVYEHSARDIFNGQTGTAPPLGASSGAGIT